MMRFLTLAIATLSLSALPASAGPEDFHPGPAIPAHGQIAAVPDAAPLPENALFRIAFDIARPADPGAVNRYLESPARFLNMHVAAGVPADRIDLAIVVHGGAHKDLLTDAAHGGDNANAELIAALIEAGVSIELCGQTAVHYGVTAEDLLPGVAMSLSAMTSHALLQQQGYTLNPF